jgi:hypothetical protein
MHLVLNSGGYVIKYLKDRRARKVTYKEEQRRWDI